MTFTLSPENYQKVLDAERQLTEVVGDLDKAEQCGIDCQQYRTSLRSQLEMISKVKANFAPKPGS